MRKIVGLIAIFLAFFLCVHGVISYTNATLENQAVLNITDPVNGLVSLVPIDDPLFIRQGEDKEALYVANNLDTPISYVLEYQHDYLSMKQPDNGFLYPGEISYITLSVADSCPTGDITLPVTLQTDFDGGSARIETDLAVFVESSDSRSGDDVSGDEEPYSDGDDADLSQNSAITSKWGDGTTDGEDGTTDGEDADLSANSVDQDTEVSSGESENESSTEI